MIEFVKIYLMANKIVVNYYNNALDAILSTNSFDLFYSLIKPTFEPVMSARVFATRIFLRYFRL